MSGWFLKLVKRCLRSAVMTLVANRGRRHRPPSARLSVFPSRVFCCRPRMFSRPIRALHQLIYVATARGAAPARALCGLRCAAYLHAADDSSFPFSGGSLLVSAGTHIFNAWRLLQTAHARSWSRRRAPSGATSPESRYDVMSGHSPPPFPGPPRRWVLRYAVCGPLVTDPPLLGGASPPPLPCFPARAFPAFRAEIALRPLKTFTRRFFYLTWLAKWVSSRFPVSCGDLIVCTSLCVCAR